MFKPGVSVARASSDLFDCELAAAQEVPQSIQVETTPTYTTPVETTCTTIGNTVTCESTGGDVYGGETYSYDANADLRARYLARCLAGRGYGVASLPPCELSRVPADLLARLSGPQRAPREDACFVSISDGAGNVVYASELLP